MDELTIFRGDYGFALDFNCQTYSGDVKNLSGYTVTMRTWSPGVPTAIIVSGACTLLSAQGGQVRYIVGSGQFMSAERYYAAIDATMSGVRESFEAFTLRVAENA